MDLLDIKTALDVGLGAVSLLLWMRQGKVNRAQVALDTQQNKTAADLTVLINEHDQRITRLESISRLPRHRKKKSA